MSENFALEQPAAAESYLRLLPPLVRKQGESEFRRGAVSELECLAPGTSYQALVQDSDRFRVDLYFEDGDWDADCTCPLEYACKHCYAAMKALLAEYNVVRVQQLSATPGRPGGFVASAKAAPQTLDERLAMALGGPLNPAQRRFVAKIEELFQRVQVQRQITVWDLRELGIRAPGQSWDALRIWPQLPTNTHEFWLYIALAARDWGQPVPDYMGPVTDLVEVQNRVRRWRRSHDIQHWEKVLGQIQASAVPVDTTRGEADLRVCFGPAEAHVELKRAGQDSFSRLRATPARQLVNEWNRGEFAFTPEAESLWQLVQQRLMHYQSSIEFPYHDPEGLKQLSRLFRQKVLHERLVTPAGQPLAWVAEPLRWDVRAPEEEDEDYTLRVVRADGSPLPPVLATLPGRPAFLLCDGLVFVAPASVDAVRLDGRETRIPAKALESPGGLDLLRRLEIEPPSRLRAQIRTVPMKVRLHCALQDSHPGSKTEQCAIRLLASSEDGVIEERWNGERWVEDKPVSTPYGQITTAPRNPSRSRDKNVYYDRSAQAGAAALLHGLDLRWDAWRGFASLRVTKKFPETFVPWLKSLPADIQVELEGDLASLANAPISGEVSLDVAEAGIDWFDLRVVLNVSDTELTQEEIKLLLDARGGYVRLEGKGWRRLHFNLSEEEDERLARLGLNPRELSSEPQRLHALQLADPAAKKFLPEAQFESVQRRAGDIQARVTPEVPASVRAELRPYQRDGFHFLCYLSANHFGGILADDMGLGKTLQTLAWLAWLREQPRPGPADHGIQPSLVVCPKSVTDNWRAEAERFTPHLRVKVWSAGELESMPQHLADADLHVINYAQLRSLGESLTPARWLALILDEGQYIKNPSSQTAQVARTLQAAHRLVLTGTPIENRLLDLWSLMAFAMPGALGSRSHFGRLFDAKEDPFARRRLAARVRPFLLRRTKSQVAKDLPDRIEEDLFCEIEGEQKTLYRAELKRAQQMLLKLKTQKQLNDERFNLLGSLLRLRQICCHPRLVQDACKAPSAKVEALLDQIEPLMEEGHKVLVFSQFVSMLDLIREAIAEKGWPIFYLAGDTENRGDLVRRFQETEGQAVFLISLKAGGFGLNLTAASYVVLFDPWWNPAVENQAIDRTHRIGQQRKVIAYRLLIKDSIEEKIRALQKTKRALADDVLGEEKFAQGLTLDDLRFLFAD